MRLTYRWKRLLVSLRHLQARNQGDWLWLKTKSAPLASLNRELWRWAEPAADYYIMLGLSAVISTLGLLANSSATIIGAMIIAPLIGPITAIAFAIAMGNRRLFKRAFVTLGSGLLLAVAIGYGIALVAGLNRLTPEISARVEPTLLDLGIALAAGAAGAFAKSRRRIGDALPGVAIAVALVPPLSVVGIGLAMPSAEVAMGATLLLVTNLASMILCGALVFLSQGYGSLKRAKRGITLSMGVLLLLILPLGLSFRDLLIRQATYSRLLELVRERTGALGQVEITTLGVSRRRQQLTVELELAAPLSLLTPEEVTDLHQSIESTLGEPVNLDLTVTPVERFRHPPVPDTDSP